MDIEENKKICADLGLPEVLADRLRGNDPGEVLADAKALADALPVSCLIDATEGDKARASADAEYRKFFPDEK